MPARWRLGSALVVSIHLEPAMKIRTESYKGHFLVCRAARGTAGLFAGFRSLGAGQLECVGYYLTEEAALDAGLTEGRRYVDQRLGEQPTRVAWTPMPAVSLAV
jgi:hypothetical protein